MTQSIQTMTTDLNLTDVLAAAIARFPMDPPNTSREMRQLLERDRESFRDAMLPLLCAEPYSIGHQYALTLLIAQGLVLDCLRNPDAMAKSDARRLVRRIDSLDRTFITKMVAGLLPHCDQSGSTRDTATVRHILELLENTTGVQRSTLFMTQLLQHSDERIRAKATLLLGKVNRNLQWAEQRMGDGDPRVRASAIESMWGLNSTEARRTFDSAVQDPHGRVAANAALALYLIGDVSAPEHLVHMLASADSGRRASAAWAMGQSGDSRFLAELASHAMDPDSRVRSNVFLALSRIRLLVKRLSEEVPLDVIVTNVVTVAGVRRLEMAILGTEGKPVPKLGPLNFIVTDDGKVVHRVVVTERRDPDLINVAFAVPINSTIHEELAPLLTQSFQMFLPYKRKCDVWNAMRYSARGQASQVEFRLGSVLLENGSGGSQSVAPERTLDPEPHIVSFIPGANALPAVSQSEGTTSGIADNLDKALASLIGSMAFSPALRLIFVIAEGSTVLTDPAALAKQAQNARVEINAIQIGSDSEFVLSRLCRETGGICVPMESSSEMPAACRRIAARLRSLYKIEYVAQSHTPSKLSIQVLTDVGFGRDEAFEHLAL